MQAELRDRLSRGLSGGATSASAHILGKNYVKQVDVVISSWQTGPELLISTKRMDSSFGKNAANRVEESYGDAKNLRLRHPQAALGFLYGLRSTVLTKEPDRAAWLIDLLGKLGREDDAYHAVGLVIPEWEGNAPPEDDDDVDAALLGSEPGDEMEEIPIVDIDVGQRLAALPSVSLRQDEVPPGLSPARFFAVMVGRVLHNSPINFHVTARTRFSQPG